MSGREKLKDGRDHLTVTGTFQSDKYEWCHAGFVPLKITDPMACDLLLEYALRRKEVDVEFTRDLTEAIQNEVGKCDDNKPSDEYKHYEIKPFADSYLIRFYPNDDENKPQKSYYVSELEGKVIDGRIFWRFAFDGWMVKEFVSGIGELADSAVFRRIKKR